jgi:hypothetical protein
MTFTGAFGFWLFLSVYVVCEAIMYMHGHETLFWKHKTPEEKQIQQQVIKESGK